MFSLMSKQEEAKCSAIQNCHRLFLLNVEIGEYQISAFAYHISTSFDQLLQYNALKSCFEMALCVDPGSLNHYSKPK